MLLIHLGADVHYNCDEPLHKALACGHATIAGHLIRSGANIHERDGSFLQIAAYKGAAEAARLLLECRADVTIDNHSALRLAIDSGHYEVVKVLLERGAKISEAHQNPLHHAVHERDVKMFKLLMEYGVDINSAKSKELLILVANQGNLDAVRLFVSCGAEMPFELNSDEGVHYAVRKGSVETLKYFLEASSVSTDVLYGAVQLLLFSDDHTDMLELLFQHGVKPTAGNLQFAAHSKNDCSLKMILKYCTNISECGEALKSALFAACKRGNMDIVHLLLAHGAQVTDVTLRVAAEKGQLEVVKFLLSLGVLDTEAECKHRQALSAAADCRHTEVVKVLVEHGADITYAIKYCHNPGLSEMLIRQLAHKDLNHAAALAAEQCLYSLTKEYLEQGADITAESRFGGKILSRGPEDQYEDSADIWELIISYGVDAAMRNNSPLKLAHKWNNKDFKAAKVLLQHGLDINMMLSDKFYCLHPRDEMNALRYACEDGNLDMIRYLVAHGADVKSHEGWALGDAIEHLDVVELLIELGADVTADSHFAAQSAAWCCSVEVMKLLLDHGADPFFEDKFLAVQSAAKGGHLEMVQFLAELGADVTADDNQALRKAVWGGHLDVIEYLVSEHDADVTACDNSAIQVAASRGHLELVKFLVQHGADASANNNKAIQQAREHDHYEVERYLSSLAA